jgi:hypothetical protein
MISLDTPPALAYSVGIVPRKNSHSLRFLSCYVLAAHFAFGWQTAIKTRQVAPGWMVSPDYAEDFEVGVDHAIAHSGKASTYIKSKPHATDTSHATIGQRIKSDAYRGKRVRLSGFLKTTNVTGRARLWMRIDSENGARQVWMDDLRWETVKSAVPISHPGNAKPASQQLTEEQLKRIVQGYVESPLQPVNMGFEH